MRIFIFLIFVLSTNLSAGIICPGDKTVDCSTDLAVIAQSDIPTLTAPHLGATLSYSDLYELYTCSTGRLLRTWYIDTNNNEQFDASEPSCIQTIYVEGATQDISISFPEDRTYICSIETDDWGSPSYTAGPCDQIAVSYNDIVYGDPSSSCYKIFREYTVIGVCLNPLTKEWVETNRWHHTQVIKVMDDGAPVIQKCEDLTIGLDSECTTELVFSNSAYDSGSCTSDEILWEVKVDMWGDGTIDYTYGYNQTGDFYVPPKNQNDTISIRIPEKVSRSRHKVIWNAKDACGKHGQCIQHVTVADIKPPTPYCAQPIFISFDGSNGDSTIIRADAFDQGSYDNCGGDVRFSFSPDVTDSVRVVKCNQAGFQFARIYHTDRAGNQDFCQIVFFVFDNGSCNSLITTRGIVHQRNCSNLPRLHASIGNDIYTSEVLVENDTFIFEDHPLYEDFRIGLKVSNEAHKKQTNLEGILLLKDYLLGKVDFDKWQKLAADVDADGRITNADLFYYRDVLLGLTDMREPYIITAEDTLSESADTIKLSAYDGQYDFYLTARGQLAQENADTRTRSIANITFEKVVSQDGTYFTNTQAHEVSAMYIDVDPYGSVHYSGGHSFFGSRNQSLLMMRSQMIYPGDLRLYVHDDYGVSLEDLDIQVRTLDGHYLNPVMVQDSEVEVFTKALEQCIHIESQDVQDIQLYTIDGVELPYESTMTPSGISLKVDYTGIVIVYFEDRGRQIAKKVFSHKK